MYLQTRASSSGNQTPTSSRSTVSRKARTPQQASSTAPSTVTTSVVVSSVPSPVPTSSEKQEVKGEFYLYLCLRILWEKQHLYDFGVLHCKGVAVSQLFRKPEHCLQVFIFVAYTIFILVTWYTIWQKIQLHLLLSSNHGVWKKTSLFNML